MREKVDVANSVEILNENLRSVARVAEWAEVMGYDCPKKFARCFLKHYYERPQAYLKYARVKSIVSDLREGNLSNFKIAIKHGIPDEVALNKFVNYHLGCSPTCVKRMTAEQVKTCIGKFGSKVR